MQPFRLTPGDAAHHLGLLVVISRELGSENAQRTERLYQQSARDTSTRRENPTIEVQTSTPINGTRFVRDWLNVLDVGYIVSIMFHINVAAHRQTDKQTDSAPAPDPRTTMKQSVAQDVKRKIDAKVMAS